MAGETPGWIARFERRLLKIFGPAQLASRDEAPPARNAPARCPMCGELMSAHDISRAGNVNRSICPPRP